MFRCDASPEIGLGHIVRCLALADELRREHGIPVGFALRGGSLGPTMVTRHGYPAFDGSRENIASRYEDWLRDSMRQVNARMLVTDVRDSLSRGTLEKLGEEGYLIAVLDDLSDRRFAADLAFYPPVPQVLRADWKMFRGRRYVGWEWSILRSQFRKAAARSPQQKPSILIAMGGTDPAGLTLHAVRVLGSLTGDFDGVIVLGRGFQHMPALEELLAKTTRRFEVLADVSDMGAVMAKATMAVCSFGMTAYELAAMGVPAIYLCLSPDHAASATAFVDAGMGWSVGIFSEVTDAGLAETIDRLLRDSGLREKMSLRSRALIDGEGATRIAEVLAVAVGKLSSEIQIKPTTLK